MLLASYHRFLTLFVLAALIVTFFEPASSQVPRQLSYQGLMTDDEGIPLSDGNYNLAFRIYDDRDAGNLLWQEFKTVNTFNGVFEVVLGDVEPLDMPFNLQ